MKGYLSSTLPPGRHGLPREFVEENQRQRILNGMARAVCLHGYASCPIAAIVQEARVSRRTFYEHFDGKEAAAKALVEFGSGFEARSLDTGLGVLTVELVALALVMEPSEALDAAREAATRVREIADSLELEEVAT
jgi:AcrR family transcriptional regulator